MLSKTSKAFGTKTLTTSDVDTKTRTIHSSLAIPLSLKELGNIRVSYNPNPYACPFFTPI